MDTDFDLKGSRLEEDIDAMRREIAALTESHNQLLSAISDIRDAVGPLMAKMENSPVLKMLGM